MSGMFAGTKWDREPHCERCDEPESECDCPPLPELEKVWVDPAKQSTRVGLEKRKKGKSVTVVRDLSPDKTDLPNLLTRLKTVCGAGGTMKDGLIEVQGDHVEKVKATLKEIGYRVR